MIELVRYRLSRLQVFSVQRRPRSRSVWAYALLGVLLLAQPLPTAAQRKRGPGLPGATVNSEPLKVYGPFREGLKVVKLEANEETEPDEDYSFPRDNGAPRTVPTIRPAGKNGVKRVATIEQAGPSAVAAVKNAPDQAKARDFSFGESFYPFPSPTPTSVFRFGASANGGDVDPQIAVSSTTVGVLTWGSLAFYDKSGTLLPSTPTFNNPTSIKTLFADVIAELDKHHLNLSALTGTSDAFKLASGKVGDARIQFDVFRRRWVIAGTAKNTGDGIKAFPKFVQLSQRRTKIILAVSRDEDPSKGFNTFSFNGSPDDGACSSTSDSEPCPGTSFTPGNAADYPSLGVSPHHYLIAVHVAHENVNGSGGDPLWGYLVAVNAQDAADGHSPRGRSFWGWPLGGGGNADGVTMPVVEHDALSPIPFGLIASTNNGKLAITLVSPNDPPSLTSLAFDISDMESPKEWLQKGSFFQLIEYGNVRTQPITAHLVDGKLIVAINDCVKWIDEQSDCSPSVHLVIADISHLPLISGKKERVFGWRNIADDDPDDVVAYGMPGAVANADGDLVVVYSRSSPRMFPEVRYSVWLHGEFDLRPSQRLRSGDASVLPDPSDCMFTFKCKPTPIDTAGVALDPFDKTAIWMAHMFANSSGKMRAMVGKVLGKQHPDLILSGVSLPSGPIHAGSQITIGYTTANGGDGVALEPRVKVILISERKGLRITLGEDIPTYLSSGESKSFNFNVNLPAHLRPGNYRVRVEGRLLGGEAEYSTQNNQAASDTKLKVLLP